MEPGTSSDPQSSISQIHHGDHHQGDSTQMHSDQTIEMVEEVYEDGIIDGMDESDEIVEETIDGLEYDPTINNQYEASVLYELYQPIEYEHGLVCRICQHAGKEIMFADRAAYTTHRYKVHGSFNNSIVCPVQNCKDAFASTIHLRKHLMAGHNIPLEMHHQIFPNMSEFERWRSMVETASHCRFIMHTKQPTRKRQILHCSKSEHKQVLQSRTRRLPRKRMQKEGSCCPAVISYRADDRSGQVHAFYQLYHVGHTAGDDSDIRDETRQISLHFPDPPTYTGDRPMQYLQIDFFEMEHGIYHSLVYSYVLMITDLTTGFFWAKPMTDPITKITVQRILCDLFCQYGVPDGFSSSSSPWQRMVKEVINTLEETFQCQIREIHNEPSDYDGFRTVLLEQAADDLKSHTRWPEVVPFAAMEINQAGKLSSFERFFKRKPHTLNPPPWSSTDREPEEYEDYSPPVPNLVLTPKSKVYIKNIDPRPMRGGAFQSFHHGIVMEVDFANSPYFPYKVYYSRTDDPQPNENCPYVWASPFDVLPTNQDLENLTTDGIPHQRHKSTSSAGQKAISELLCSCKEGTSEEPCLLFRSWICVNGMSKVCCAASGKQCGYHENTTGDDSYLKMEKLTKLYSDGCSEQEKKRLRVLLKLSKDGKGSGEFVEEAEEFYIEEPPGPPAKKRRQAAKSGAGSIILRNADTDETKEITFTNDVNLLSFPKRTVQRVIVEQGLRNGTPPETIEEEVVGNQRLEVPEMNYSKKSQEQEYVPNEAILNVYQPPASSRQTVKQLGQDPVRRSGRATKTKVYKDFITE